MPAILRDQLTQDRDQDQFPVPHDPQALFAAGVTDNGNHLFWITTPRTAPDTWCITVNQPRDRDWYTFDGTLTDFLTAVLGGHAQVPVFPDDLPDGASPSLRPPPGPLPRRHRPPAAGGASTPRRYAHGPAPWEEAHPA
ncbi:hypothetical protein [Streptomyces radiopugnans]|uniref:SMI1/KNR4 family protein n=1 Tax=Streptomyces radiopugnans TaxID=403935 RepID=A0A1H9JFC6_9ACTN|nr:hypothetical protein [Streptomyces radiopugnans]SEQ85265.1 hypothetical protein SAMN05216481_11766 [Streptomyces radiopugnans]